MMRHSNLPQRIYSPVPYSILVDDDYAPSVGDVQPGVTYLNEKQDRYRTTRGTFGIEEYNRRVRDSQPKTHEDRFRFLCEPSIKYRYDGAAADELYKLHQENSRNLRGRGAGLRRSDIEALRG